MDSEPLRGRVNPRGGQCRAAGALLPAAVARDGEPEVVQRLYGAVAVVAYQESSGAGPDRMSEVMADHARLAPARHVVQKYVYIVEPLALG